tara:strand:+ start:1380 stop:2288 length:909 start_codon:yes stop_codon:yes gene_type:complete
MIISDIKKFSNIIEGDIFWDYEIKKLNWLNIGGKTRIFFKPNSLKELVEFLKLYSDRGKIFILGLGSNVLFKDDTYEGVIIKLGKNFSNISLLNEETIVAGGAVTQKKLSEFAKNNQISGLEFLSCIPGSVGGGIRMNSGCFDREFKDVLISIQVIDFNGNIKTIPAGNINFQYRKSDLPTNNIFLSATFKGLKKNINEIDNCMKELKNKKEQTQPTKVKTGGSTFKNPKDQTDKKVWQLIKDSVPKGLSFGDAKISDKHANFFINKKDANYKDMKKLIDYVKSKVRDKTGVNINLEIVIVE